MEKHLSHNPIPVISDVGAYVLKPLFVIGTIITSLTFVATLASFLYLQAPQNQPQEELPELSSPIQNAIVVAREAQTRLPAHGRKSERILAIMALIGALIGGVGLILLSGFDTSRYPTLHRVFLTVFMFGVALSAILTMVQVCTSSFYAQGRSYARVWMMTPLNSSRFSLARIGAEIQMITSLLERLLFSKEWLFLSCFPLQLHSPSCYGPFEKGTHAVMILLVRR